MLRRTLLSAVVIFAAGCDPAGENRLLDIDANGTVEGIVFLDLDASATPGAADEPAVNFQVALVLEGTADTLARVRTDAEGVFTFENVPTGTYDVVVPPNSLGDSVRVVFRDPPGVPVELIGPADETSVTVARDDSVSVTLGIGYFVYSVEEARMLPAGRRVFVRGVALASINAIADSSLYLQGAMRAMRVTRATGDDVIPGDTVLALGTTGTRDGQPVLIAGDARIEGSDAPFDTIATTAGVARDADAAFLDAQLIRLREVVVTDTATIGSRFVITVEDPSGTVAVVVPAGSTLPAHAPGTELDVIGLLVPAPGVAGTWQVRPRSPDDLLPDS